MEDLQAMLARYKAEGASSETLEEVCSQRNFANIVHFYPEILISNRFRLD